MIDTNTKASAEKDKKEIAMFKDEEIKKEEEERITKDWPLFVNSINPIKIIRKISKLDPTTFSVLTSENSFTTSEPTTSSVSSAERSIPKQAGLLRQS